MSIALLGIPYIIQTDISVATEFIQIDFDLAEEEEIAFDVTTEEEIPFDPGL